MSPPVVLRILLAGTFWIHYALVLLLLGTPLIVAARGDGSDRGVVAGAHRFFTGGYTMLMSFTITTGVAPLLFLQVTAHRLFYQTMINGRWLVLSSLLSMVVVFYASYAAKAWPGRRRMIAGFVSIGLGHVVVSFMSLRKGLVAHQDLIAHYWAGTFPVPWLSLIHHAGSALVSTAWTFYFLERGRWRTAAAGPLLFSMIFTVIRERARWAALPGELGATAVLDGSTVVFLASLGAGTLWFRGLLRVR